VMCREGMSYPGRLMAAAVQAGGDQAVCMRAAAGTLSAALTMRRLQRVTRGSHAAWCSIAKGEIQRRTLTQSGYVCSARNTCAGAAKSHSESPLDPRWDTCPPLLLRLLMRQVRLVGRT
jgi:hypothetical protein